MLAVDAVEPTSHRLRHIVLRVDPDERWPWPLRSREVWNGVSDRSLLKLWGLLQLSVAAVLLVRLVRRAQGRRVLGMWEAVLLAMFLDDLFCPRERA
ncbi:hypothetical protein [Kocuria rosea]|uniref:hypothetical protein n=1 Tax=Kocuria rosea TaxID=1275 RepID=UPI000DF971E8|nr:hypothetical protein [Kocuria rosea]STX04959.1 Uncharacterised protein [Kocuria rosea]